MRRFANVDVVILGEGCSFPFDGIFGILKVVCLLLVPVVCLMFVN